MYYLANELAFKNFSELSFYFREYFCISSCLSKLYRTAFQKSLKESLEIHSDLWHKKTLPQRIIRNFFKIFNKKLFSETWNTCFGNGNKNLLTYSVFNFGQFSTAREVKTFIRFLVKSLNDSGIFLQSKYPNV